MKERPIHDYREKTYLGKLVPNAYDGKYVLQLDVESNVEQCEEPSIDIPLNVLREIADYGAAPKVDLSDAERLKRMRKKRR